MDAEDSEELPQIATHVTVRHMYELWVYPELVRRGKEPVPENARSALVVLHKDYERPIVKLSGEFEMIARVEAKRDIAAGEDVSSEDVGDPIDLWPQDIDEDAGWIAFVTLPTGQQYLAFDFVQQRGVARKLVERAEEYMRAANSALASGDDGPALDNALAAAELAVIAQMRTLQAEDDPKNKHQHRYGWFDGWARLGNAPEAQAQMLKRLAQLRGFARYGDERQRPSPGEPMRLCRLATEMVADIRKFVTRPQDRDATEPD